MVEGIEFVLAGEQQELLELAAEIAGPRRIVERQRGERIEHPVPAGRASVESLYADDRHQVLGRHLVLGCDVLEREP